jgi:predicted TIM-barrel fold metal-dependent hydrolase
VISADGHVGLPAEKYRDYLEATYHGAFDDYLKHRAPTGLRDLNLDEWVEEYERRWHKTGKYTAMWDPNRRIEVLEAEGAAAEVLFPDRTRSNEMPFSETAHPEDATLAEKMAGERAYNRWIAEFCSAYPSRLAGLTSLRTFVDPDAMVAEIEWSAAQPGVRGVMLPGVGPNRGDWLDEKYERVWSACEDTGMIVHYHVGAGLPPRGSDEYPPTLAGGLLAVFEGFQWAQRALWWLIFGGVLERHPRLRVAFTETGSRWAADAIAKMDWLIDMPYRLHALNHLVPLKPSEYFHRQCAIGASILSLDDITNRHAIGVENMMVGLDLPHFEGTLGITLPYLRRTFGVADVPEDETRAILGESALRFYGFDPKEMAAVAARVGPSAEDVLTKPGDDLNDLDHRFGEDHFFWTRKPA